MSNYHYVKIPWHIRQYVKKELMDYEKNKKLLSKLKGSTRELLLLKLRLEQIERVFERLDKNDREAAQIIFIDKYTQGGAEVAKGISKGAYYNAMNKIIYLTAVEMELI